VFVVTFSIRSVRNVVLKVVDMYVAHDVTCASICSSSGVLLTWVKEMKYLGLTFTISGSFKISTGHSRRAFHRAADEVV